MTKPFLLLILSSILLTGCKTNVQEYFHNQKGNDFYKQENYVLAQEEYSKALAKNPNSPALHYNMANILQKEDKLDEALAEYSQALTKASPKEKNSIYYNMGNLFYEKQDAEKAIASYIHALKQNPKDLESKKNLELALRLLKQQQQQKPKPQPQKKDDKKDEEKDKQKEEQKVEKIMAEKLLEKLKQEKKFKPKEEANGKLRIEKDW
jgi:Ca-activated chloride channel homolog